MEKVPMVDLGASLEEIEDEVLEELKAVLKSCRYILGPKVKAFEDEVKNYIGVEDAIAVASGTDALKIGLDAMGVSKGDEVITTPFTFFATAESIVKVGAVPVFVDIDPDTYNISPQAIKKAITPKTRAILPVHLFGHPAEMDKIEVLAEERGISILEDCAQSFGATYRGRKTGSIGHAGAFSFYPSKNLGGFGDGGLITTKDPQLALKIRKLRNHGAENKTYLHSMVGYNSRLDEIQAAFLLIKLKRIEDYNKRRRQKAKIYTNRLSSYVHCPVEKEGCFHVYHQYTIRTPLRDRIKEALRAEGIASVVYYPLPLHLQKALQWLGYKERDFPIAERTSREVLSLPIYPELPEETIHRICDIIINTVKKG